MRLWRALLIALTVGFGSVAGAQTVTLTANSGELSLSGVLRAFDGRYYQLETEFGLVTIAGERVFCAGDACPGDAETTGFSLTVERGLGTVLLPALVEAFAAQQGLPLRRRANADGKMLYELGSDSTNRRYPIRLSLADSAEGFADLAVGQADMVFATRFPSPSEATIIADAGLGDLSSPAQEMLLAVDALAVVTAPGAGLNGFRMSSGGTATSALDILRHGLSPAPAGALELHLRGGSDDVAQVFGPGTTERGAMLHASGQSVMQAVRDRRDRVGLVPVSTLGVGQSLPVLGACGLGLPPDSAHLQSGDYPFLIPVLAYLPGRRLPRDLIGFIAFLRSDAAARVVDRANLIRPEPVPLRGYPLAERLLSALALSNGRTPAERYRAVAGALFGAQRLGLAIRPARAGRLEALLSDASSEALIAAADRGQFAHATLILASFGGSASQLQAQVLRDLLHDRNVRRVEVFDFETALPVACQDDPWARRLNERVEVWLRP